jgi:hypothetical protein
MFSFNKLVMDPTKYWDWRWYWIPYEPHWLIIPSIVWFWYPGSSSTINRANARQWSLGIQWGKWFVGFGAHIYSKKLSENA